MHCKTTLGLYGALLCIDVAMHVKSRKGNMSGIPPYRAGWGNKT
jgi:hypothetical protein